MKQEVLDLFVLVEKQLESKGLSEEELKKQGLLDFYNSLKANHSFVEEHVKEDNTEKLESYKKWLEKNSENLTKLGFKEPEIEEEIEEDEEIDEETKTVKSKGKTRSKIVKIVVGGVIGAVVVSTALAAWAVHERERALNEYAKYLQSQQTTIESQLDEEYMNELTAEDYDQLVDEDSYGHGSR